MNAQGRSAAYPFQRRRDLAERIARNADHAREYGEGTEAACATAISACKQVIADATELLGELEDRALLIAGMDLIAGGYRNV